VRVRMIQSRFVEPLITGAKVTTIRPSPWIVGETYDIRVWTGKPYRSPQRHIAFRKVVGVKRVTVSTRGVFFEEWDDTPFYVHAMRDGFSSWTDMLDWFQANHKEIGISGFHGWMMEMESV